MKEIFNPTGWVDILQPKLSKKPKEKVYERSEKYDKENADLDSQFEDHRVNTVIGLAFLIIWILSIFLYKQA